ncbi:MAG TPA: (Fe-S)-binding protein [Thermoleophilia bacterium]|nr:(Fe-S)-binding protein [Thermoleophilia bacterium]
MDPKPSAVEARGAAVALPNGVAELRDLYDEVAKCGRCGFCQPTCPVYTATAREAHVARGKNMLFRNLIEGETALEPDLREAFENCLLCRACTANCFPAVKTDLLVVAFRETYGKRFGRPTVQRWIFRRLLPYPKRMSRIIGLLWLARRLGLAGMAKRLGLLRMINPKLEKAMEIREEVPAGFLRTRLKRRVRPEPAPSRLKVGYWISCGYNYMLPEVGEATVDVLEENGMEVEVLPNACCGLPVYGYGDIEGARLLARTNLDKLGDLKEYDYIVSDCGSCSGHLKEYADLLKDEPEYAERAKVLVSKVRGFSELMQATGVTVALGELPVAVTYHDPCHLGARYQGIVTQPRELIRSIPGVDYRELAEADWCCGAAGSYNFMHNEISMKILGRKVENIEKSGADVIVTECPACIMQLSLGAKRRGLSKRVLSVSQLIQEARRARRRETVR